MCSEYCDSLEMYALCNSILVQILWESMVEILSGRVGHRRLQR